MELYFLDEDFEEIHILDSFMSLIWTDRYWACGDLDLVVSPTDVILSKLLLTKYFALPGLSEHNMVYESVNLHSDLEDGNKLIIQGRSLESILDRRIVWTGTTLTGNFQTGIQRLLNESIISPTDSDRDISNFEFLTSTDTAITSLTVDSQFVGNNIYKLLTELCELKGVGFRIFFNKTTSTFQFKLYSGLDRSYGQTDNDTVAFTSALNNLLNADYVESGRLEKTVILVAGEEGVGNTRTTVEVPAPGGSKTGLDRKETYIEANINRNSPDGDLTEAEYIDALEGKGAEELAKKTYVKAFDGEIDTTMYNYGDEFNMGDILQIADDYGHQTTSRVKEMIFSQNKEGIKMYPTFENVDL